MIDVNALVLTFDEEPNIGRVLERLAWVPRVLVVDSFSQDRTPEIVCSFSNTEFVQRRFTSFADQCNFGLRYMDSDWVLSLDADYLCTPELAEELQRLVPEHDGYRVPFRYCIHGTPLRGSLYPPRTVLYRRTAASYRQDGHAHRVEIEGSVGTLSGCMLHDDRKPLQAWLAAQQRYAWQEAEKLTAAPEHTLSRIDRLRKIPGLAPLLAPLYCMLVKRTVLDGRAGLFYTAQRTYAELLLTLRLMEKRYDAQALSISAPAQHGDRSPITDDRHDLCVSDQ